MNLKQIVYGAVAGIVAAEWIDIEAWKAWLKHWKDGDESYPRPNFEWRKALIRMAKGAIAGAATAAGIGAVPGLDSILKDVAGSIPGMEAPL